MKCQLDPRKRQTAYNCLRTIIHGTFIIRNKNCYAQGSEEMDLSGEFNFTEKRKRRGNYARWESGNSLLGFMNHRWKSGKMHQNYII